MSNKVMSDGEVRDEELREYLTKRLNEDPEFCANVVVPALTHCIIPMEDIFSEYKRAAEFNRKAMGARKLELADKKRIEYLKTKMEWEKTPNNVFTIKDIPSEIMEVIEKVDANNDNYKLTNLLRDLIRWGKGEIDILEIGGEFYFSREGMIRVAKGIWNVYDFDREDIFPWTLRLARMGDTEDD